MFILNISWYKVFYWMTVADSLKSLLNFMAIASFVLLLIYTLAYVIINYGADYNPGGDKQWKPQRWIKRVMYTLLFVCLFSAIGWALMPTKKDMLMIVVGGTVGNFVTTDSSSKAIPADLTRYLHKALQKEVSDLDADTKAELGVETPKEKLIRKAKDMTKDELIQYLQTDSTTLK